MEHSHDKPLPEVWEPGTEADLNTGMIVYIGLIGIVLLIVIIIVLRALYYETANQEATAKMSGFGKAALSDVASAQLTQINSYSWVNPRGGVVGLPIDRAIELTVQEYSGDGSGAPPYRPDVTIPGDMTVMQTGVPQWRLSGVSEALPIHGMDSEDKVRDDAESADFIHADEEEGAEGH